MDKKREIENLARAAFEKRSFNGAWLYAENGETVSKGAFGFRDAEDRIPMTDDSIFEMASVTKPFTSAAVMLLVRDGKLGLDDEYARYFEKYPYAGVTVRHLLTHTSGMPEELSVAAWVSPVYEKERRIPPCAEIVRYIAESGKAPDCAPGERFHYTDVGYCLLANLVEKLSGVGFEDFIKKNIFEPAGMKDSGIYHTRRDGVPSGRFTRNMVLEDGGYAPSDVSKLTAPYVVGSDGMNGCDYLYTTVSDMLAFDRALREEKALTREEQRVTYTPVKLNGGSEYADGDDGYGLGWRVRAESGTGLVVSHSGGMPGLYTLFERFVDADRTIVVMNCREPSDEAAFEAFIQGLEDAARGK